jgi:hypothetical protein
MEFFVILALKRAFAPTQSFSNAPEAPGKPMPMEEVRQRLMQTLKDCQVTDAQRLGIRVQATRNAKELWMLRSDLYDCIARHHSQTEAARRINGLLSCFEGWLPPGQLTRI